MPLKILVVPDKFKGTLTAIQAAEAIASGWRDVRCDDPIELLPMSDGGDGFGDVLSRLFTVQTHVSPTVDAAHRPRNAQWWWEPNTKNAIIESAQVIGLALLPEGEFHPFDLDTTGLGAPIEQSARLGAQRCIVGIGGSATNDGGFGIARSLGWRFLDSANRPIERWRDLTDLSQIQKPESRRHPSEIIVATDVRNPLLGDTGASRIYGPQKGLREEDMRHAEACLGKLAQMFRETFPDAAHKVPGDGAAGGLGFGLRCFLDARLESGFELFAQYADLEKRIACSQLIITGEGAIDASTRMGKGVGEIARLSEKHNVPCIGLAGTVIRDSETPTECGRFRSVYGIAPDLTDSDAAKQNPAIWLRRLANQVALNWC